MAWGNGGNPWGGGTSGGGGGGKRPANSNRPPAPDYDELLRKSKEQLKGFIPGGGAGGGFIAIIAILIIAALAWVFLTFKVNPDEQAVVLRFGEYHRTAGNGLHFRLPAPFEQVIIATVSRINDVEVGFRSANSGNRSNATNLRQESLMLTGDENIVDISFSVQWRINSLKDYIFNIKDAENLVRPAAESAMREVIGRTKYDEIIGSESGKGLIQNEVQQVMQKILDGYNSGILIVNLQLQTALPPEQVIDDFRDVQRAAADQERLKNEAEAYANDIIPRARGEAAKLLNEAEAYRQQVIARAKGEADRFLSVYEEYRQAPDVTKKRLYLETMEEVLKNSNKTIIDSKSSQGVLPYLPIQNNKVK